MLDKITHTNSNNETLDFTSLGIFVNYNDLRDFEWTVETKNNRITGFYKGVVKKTIPFIFYVDEKKASEIKNQFYEHFEIDIFNNEKGYFEINGYRYYCYAVKSVKSKYLIDKRLLYLSIEITTDDPCWIKKSNYIVDFNEMTSSESTKYPYTYPFEYVSSKAISIINKSFTESDAIIRIYGECTNPLVNISENIYQIGISLVGDEYAEIDTFNKTIIKFSSDGTRTNIFDYRDKTNDAFKKIPKGDFSISTNGKFKIDIELVERRGEPRWD